MGAPKQGATEKTPCFETGSYQSVLVKPSVDRRRNRSDYWESVGESAGAFCCGGDDF